MYNILRQAAMTNFMTLHAWILHKENGYNINEQTVSRNLNVLNASGVCIYVCVCTSYRKYICIHWITIVKIWKYTCISHSHVPKVNLRGSSYGIHKVKLQGLSIWHNCVLEVTSEDNTNDGGVWKLRNVESNMIAHCTFETAEQKEHRLSKTMTRDSKAWWCWYFIVFHFLLISVQCLS